MQVIQQDHARSIANTVPLEHLSQSIGRKNISEISSELFIELQRDGSSNSQTQRFLKTAIDAQKLILEDALQLTEGVVSHPIVLRIQRYCSHTEFTVHPELECQTCSHPLSDCHGSFQQDVLIKIAIAESLCVHKFPNPYIKNTGIADLATRVLIWNKLESMIPCNTGAIVSAITETLQTAPIQHLSQPQKMLLCRMLSQYRFLYSTLSTAMLYREILHRDSAFRAFSPSQAIGLIASMLQAALQAKNIIQHSLESLSNGESTIIPCPLYKHAILIEFKKLEARYEALVYNTGQNSSLHTRTQPNGRKHTYIFPVIYQNIQHEHIDELATELVILTTKILMPLHQKTLLQRNPPDQSREVYQILQRFGKESLPLPSDDSQPLAYKIQSFKSCQTSCIQAWLRQYFKYQEYGLQSYREFKFSFLNLLLESIEAQHHSPGQKQLFSQVEHSLLYTLMDEVRRKRKSKKDRMQEPLSCTMLWPKYICM